MLSRGWRYSWSSTDGRCSNYIWVINKSYCRLRCYLYEAWRCILYISTAWLKALWLAWQNWQALYWLHHRYIYLLVFSTKLKASKKRLFHQLVRLCFILKEIFLKWIIAVISSFGFDIRWKFWINTMTYLLPLRAYAQNIIRNLHGDTFIFLFLCTLISWYTNFQTTQRFRKVSTTKHIRSQTEFTLRKRNCFRKSCLSFYHFFVITNRWHSMLTWLLIELISPWADASFVMIINHTWMLILICVKNSCWVYCLQKLNLKKIATSKLKSDMNKLASETEIEKKNSKKCDLRITWKSKCAIRLSCLLISEENLKYSHGTKGKLWSGHGTSAHVRTYLRRTGSY